MAKKLIYTTVEIIDVSFGNDTITIPANTKEYFHVKYYGVSIPATKNYYVNNNTSESIPIVITKNGEIKRTYTAEPHISKSITIDRGEILHIPDFKNYEDAIFIEWPKS